MKKFLITCFYLSVTLAVCAAGFLLPSALNNYQDRQIFAKIEHPAIEPTELTYSSSLYDTLRLFTRAHYFVEYPSTGSKRTDEEIYTIASESIQLLQKYNVISSDLKNDITNYTTSLQLAVVTERNDYTNLINDQPYSSAIDAESSTQDESEPASVDITTAVVWSCSIYFKSGYWIDIWIDDKSGKAVSFSMFIEQTQELASSGNRDILDTFANAAAKFAEHYYELPATALEPSIVRSFSSLFEKDAGIIQAYYTIQLKEENGTLIQVPFKIRPECIILN